MGGGGKVSGVFGGSLLETKKIRSHVLDLRYKVKKIWNLGACKKGVYTNAAQSAVCTLLYV